MKKYPILQPCPDGTYKLYRNYNIYGVKVPKGFKTDGLTLKNRVLRIIVDKYQPKFAPFFVIHDYLCSLKEYKKADEIGQKILFNIECSLRTKLMMLAIKLYHKIKYKV